MPNKTTKADFNYFVTCCEAYMAAWGITEWKVYFEHYDIGDAKAICLAELLAMRVTFKLNTDWGENDPVTRRELKDAAKHEVIHNLLSPIDTLGRSRYVSKDELDQGSHAVVQRLMKLLPEI